MIGTLYTKTKYSMLNSTLDLEVLFRAHKERGYDFIALADTNLHALYKFLVLSKKYEITPIIGLELTINFRDLNLNVLVYARNDNELKELTKLATLKETSNELLFADIVNELNKLVVILPTYQNYIINNYKNTELIKDILQALKQRIKSFYVGISNQTELLNDVTYELKPHLESLGITMVPARKVSYLDKEDIKNVVDI